MSAVFVVADTRRKIVAAGRLLQSDKPGEVMAAVAAIRRLLPTGVSIPDLIERSVDVAAPPPFLTKRETRRAAARMAASI